MYFSKKNTLVTKVYTHLGKMESVFKVYYEALDKMRHEMLGEEYEYLEKMDGLEHKLARVVNSMKKYNVMEFFHEERELNQQLETFRNDLDSFNIYLPKTVLTVSNFPLLEEEITTELTEKMKGLIKQIDHGFAIRNYDYIIKNVRDARIKEIYKSMGPYDHFAHKDLEDNEQESDRRLQKEFCQRKSGAQFRGQMNSRDKPDGNGFKVFPNNSVYEGFFEDGMVHGQGRGITSRGEVYEGNFDCD